ncbi:MAG: M61 family metallopeptidase, partial [Prevotella sp.]|nr:M61 family metallopeptidase [Prevotella sp.]
GLKQVKWDMGETMGTGGRSSLTPVFDVKDFDTLYDSPLLLGNFTLKEFAHEGRGYEFALETPEGADEMDLQGNFCKIVSAATRLMGDVPYTFYSLIHMGAGGGGLEHLNSQACYTDGTYRFSSRRHEVKFLAFVAHEYFHLYNVKCIRPAELWPLDYNQEAFTPMLWVSEGLTCYYEFRLLRYAGIATPDEALELLTTYFSMYAPYEGQRHMSLRQSSYDIWLNFMNRDDNARDVRVNYYFKGPVIGLLLDIDIRRKTQQRHSLDDVMRLLYQRFYKELKRGFTEEEFWSLCAEVAGQPLTDVRRLVDTTQDIDYASYLDEAGLEITDDWQIRRVEKPTKQQRAFLKAMQLDE